MISNLSTLIILSINLIKGCYGIGGGKSHEIRRFETGTCEFVDNNVDINFNGVVDPVFWPKTIGVIGLKMFPKAIYASIFGQFRTWEDVRRVMHNGQFGSKENFEDCASLLFQHPSGEWRHSTVLSREDDEDLQVLMEFFRGSLT